MRYVFVEIFELIWLTQQIFCYPKRTKTAKFYILKAFMQFLSKFSVDFWLKMLKTFNKERICYSRGFSVETNAVIR